MKRIAVSILFILLMIPVFSLADVDLTGMSYDELLALREEILEEMMGREEFKSVLVPIGCYTVGEDIPEGYYALSLPTGGYMAMVTLNTYTLYTVGNGNDVGKLPLKNGDTLEIQVSGVEFTTYTGLGF